METIESGKVVRCFWIVGVLTEEEPELMGEKRGRGGGAGGERGEKQVCRRLGAWIQAGEVFA